MIYVLPDNEPKPRDLWVKYVERCIEWRADKLQRLIRFEPQRSLKQQQNVRTALAQSLHLKGYSAGRDCEERPSDALAVWKDQPAESRLIVTTSIAAKFSVVPKRLGLLDTPRRFVYLPCTAWVLANAVADVARDIDIIWTFRKDEFGQDDPMTREVFPWRIAAYALAAFANRKEYFNRTWEKELEHKSWLPRRFTANPDLPDLELIPSWI
jgi:hypothetical protein